jgi:hypothetical protein
MKAQDARGWTGLKRGCWVLIESRLHHALDLSLDEDRGWVRGSNAALVLGPFRRLVVSVANAWLDAVQTEKTCGSVGRFIRGFAHRDGGLHAVIFAKTPVSGRLFK